MIAALAAFALAAQPQSLTFAEPAMRLDRLLQKIGEQTGRDLRCADVFKDDYVLLAADKQPVDEVLKRVAELVKGDWEAGNGYTFLAQRRKVDDSGEAEKLLAEKYRVFFDSIRLTENYDEAHVRNLYEEFIDLQKISDNAQRSKEGEKFLYSSPVTRASVKMLKAIGPEKLASIPAQRQVVFASRPTRLQQPMPAGWEEILDQLNQEDSLKNSLRREYEPRIGMGFTAHAASFARPMIPDQGKPADTWFVVRRRGEQLVASFAFYDSRGQYLLRFVGDESFPFFGVDLQPKAVPAFTDVQGEFAFSEEAVDWWHWLSGFGEEKEDYPGDLIRSVLLQETERDPLSFGVSELLQAVAQKSGKPILALVDDDLMRLRARDQKPIVISSLLDTLKTSGDLVLQQEGEWLISAPVSLSDTRARRIDREQAAIYLRGLNKDSELPIRRVVNMAASVGTEVRLRNTLEYAEQGRRRSLRSFFPRSYLSLMVLANLDGPSQTRILRGEVVTLGLGNLSSNARFFVEEMLASGRGFGDMGEDWVREMILVPQTFLASESQFRNTKRSEPSYLLAQPEASGLTITLSYQVEHGFLIRREQEGGAGNIEPIGSSLIRIERGEQYPDNPLLFAYEPVGYLRLRVAVGNMVAPEESHFRLRPGQSDWLPGDEAMKRYKKFFDEARQRAADPPRP